MLTVLNRAKWLLSGNILFAFSQWLMLIFFSKMSTPEQLGYYSYALALTAPIFLLSNLQLRPLLIADLNTKNSFSFSQYFSLRIITTALAILTCLAFINWQNQFSAVILIVVIAIKASEGLSDIIYAHYNARKKTSFISKSLSIKSFIVISASFITLYLYNNVIYSLIATLIGYIGVLFFIDIKQNRKNIEHFHFLDSRLKDLFIIGLPLGLAVMLVSLQTNIPRYFIKHYWSVELVGIYTIFYYFLVIGSIVINSVCQYLSPYFAEYYEKKEFQKLIKSIFQAFGVAIILGGVGLLVSYFLHEFIIGLIYSSDYVQYSYILPYIMFAGVFSYLSVITGYLLTSLRLLKIQLPIFLVLVLFTVFYSYLFIPRYGLIGGAYTTILSTATQFLITAFIVFRKIRGSLKNV